MEGLSKQESSNLKAIIKDLINNNPLFSTLKEKLKTELDSQSVDKETIIAKIKESGLLPELLKVLDSSKINEALRLKEEEKGLSLKSKKLICCVNKGSKFEIFENAPGKLMISICCFGQIRRSKEIDCCHKPVFNEIFVFEIANEEKQLQLKNLIQLSEPIHIVLIQIVNGKKEIIAAQKMEWRRALVTGVLEEKVEMNGQNFRMNGPLGYIDVIQ